MLFRLGGRCLGTPPPPPRRFLFLGFGSAFPEITFTVSWTFYDFHVVSFSSVSPSPAHRGVSEAGQYLRFILSMFLFLLVLFSLLSSPFFWLFRKRFPSSALGNAPLTDRPVPFAGLSISPFRETPGFPSFRALTPTRPLPSVEAHLFRSPRARMPPVGILSAGAPAPASNFFPLIGGIQLFARKHYSSFITFYHFLLDLSL